MIGKQLQTRILQPAKTVVDANILDAISSTGNQKSGGGGGGSSGGGSSGGGGYAAPAPDYATQIESNTQRLYESTFRPDPIEFTALTEEQMKTQIAAWLRPGYDRAIANRREQTKVYGAELDADALSRGMGASTYVTDVKSRQQKEEARDVALLETDYGAVLAKNLMESLDKQQDRQLDVEKFNKEQEQEAYAMAYDAALALISLGMGGGGGSSKRRSGGGGGSSSSSGVTSSRNVETFLSSLTNEQRANVYAGNGAQNAAYRQEIIDSVGVAGFYQMQKEYSSLP